MNFVQPYEIACIQPRAHRCPADPTGRDEAIAKNLTRQLELIDYATAFGRSNVKIAVLPEYGINGAWEERSVEEWIRCALEIPNPWTDLLAEKARERNLYICANMLEKDSEWPGRFFNTSFIIDPRGEIILKHWKHNHNAFLLPYTSPCDVYDEFIRRYGREALFPVVDTPLGRLGCLTCCECMFPELARCTVFNGAEVILHPTSEFQDQITETTDFLKIARAVDTVSYWVSANIGEYANAARGLGASRGRSLIIDYMGQILAATPPGPGETTTRATVDINMLRYQRNRSISSGTVRTEMFSHEYAAAKGGWRSNLWLDQPIEGLDETRAVRQRNIRGNYESGVWPEPACDLDQDVVSVRE